MTAASNKIHQSDRIEKKFDSIVPADGIIEKGKKKAFSPLPFPVIGQLPSNRITTNYLSIPADRFPKISFRSGGNRFSYPKIPLPKLDHLETLGRVLAGFPHPPPSLSTPPCPKVPRFAFIGGRFYFPGRATASSLFSPPIILREQQFRTRDETETGEEEEQEEEEETRRGSDSFYFPGTVSPTQLKTSQQAAAGASYPTRLLPLLLPTLVRLG